MPRTPSRAEPRETASGSVAENEETRCSAGTDPPEA